MYEELAKKLIDESKHMVLAVVAQDGRPWAVTVKKKAYENGALYWESRVNTDHSFAIETNPQVAITLWDGQEIVKIHAEVSEISRDKTGLAQYKAEIRDAKFGATDYTNHWLDVERLRGL
jgi:pyridoxine/pyridoxamine 5'-phosphate oxidase